MAKQPQKIDPRPPLTAEELRLIATPDSVLRKEASSTPSFDYSRMVERVSGEAWQIVIQSHLYIDHTVSAILSENIPNPGALRLDRQGLSQKVDLVSAMKLLPDWQISLIRSLNKLRNSISHQLDFEITSIQEAEVLKRVPRHLEDHVRSDKFPYDGYDLRKVLIHLLMLTDLMRLSMAADRALGKKAALQLRKAADDITQGKRMDVGLLG